MALKEQYAGEVEFIIADIDTNEAKQLLEQEKFEAPYIPYFYFLDNEGEIVFAEAGIFNFEEMQEIIEQIIAE